MKISPVTMAIVYFIMGISFIYIAIQVAADSDTVWNLITLLLAGVATLDFIVGYRLMNNYFRGKKSSNKKK